LNGKRKKKKRKVQKIAIKGVVMEIMRPKKRVITNKKYDQYGNKIEE